MIGLAIALLLTLFFSEYVYQVRSIFFRRINLLLHTGRKSFKVIRSKNISEHWKELVILRYARELIVNTLILAAIFFFGIFVIVITALVVDHYFGIDPPVISVFFDIGGLLITTISSACYVLIRQRLNAV